MPDANYPSTLPGPTGLVSKANERRLLLGPNAVGLSARTFQREVMAVHTCNFEFDSAQAQIFSRWYANDIANGGAWFQATWPKPSGQANTVYRFLAEPHWVHAGNGKWIVSAKTELRLTTPILCQQFFLERFLDGLAPYTEASGDTSIYSLVDSPYGAAIRIGPQAGGAAYLRRAVSPTGTLKRVLLKFKLSGFAVDDGAVLFVYNSALTKLFGILGRPTAGADSFRRPIAQVGTEVIIIGPPLVADEWYQYELFISPGVNQTRGILTRLSDSTVIGNALFSSSHTPDIASKLEFSIDSSNLTDTTQYADVFLYDCW